jgi:hypothetical protein
MERKIPESNEGRSFGGCDEVVYVNQEGRGGDYFGGVVMLLTYEVRMF